MNYSIGEVAKKLNFKIHTLRYYDREGLIPSVERTANGTRVFKESDIELLKFIQCLKNSGMAIKDIKNFIEWSSEGDSTLQQRYDLFQKQKIAVEKQIEELQEALNVIEHKSNYYKAALDAGTEDAQGKKKIGTSVLD
ncbi:MerR family transcriptional regulator [Oceanobacillus sp. CFH 90083]|uniref:MerR family transcriptional regulator n=1 Tax=Oceanobacillus sp. CFH 90083 TaxID=2592336 RepID=UPI00128C9EB2|nr:MerR family transcriptional regulator [Oceanobacillus sp. CFH 90083]